MGVGRPDEAAYFNSFVAYAFSRRPMSKFRLNAA